MRSAALLVTALILAAPPSRGADQTPLVQEFEEVGYLDILHVAKQTVRVLGRTKESETTIRLRLKLRPVRVTRTETALEVTVVGCDDTSVTKGEPDEKGIFAGLKDQKFRVNVGAGNRALEIVTTKELVEAVFGDEARNGTEAEKKFAAEMVNVVLRVHLLDAFVPLPEKPVSPGDKWKNTAEFSLQPITRVTADREYVFAGQQVHEGKKVDVVNWASKVDFKPLKDDGGFPFKMKEMKPVGKPQNEGTVLWDRDARRPVRVDAIQTYELTMVLDIDGKEVKGTGNGTDTFVIRYLGKNPDAK